MHIIMYMNVQLLEAHMQTTTFTEFRNNASHYLDLAEQGESIVIIRHGKPVAELKPIDSQKKIPSWKTAGLNLSVPGVSLSDEIIKQRREEKEDFVSFFRNSPLCGVDLSIERDTSSTREIDLGD